LALATDMGMKALARARARWPRFIDTMVMVAALPEAPLQPSRHPDHYSIVIFDLTKAQGDTQLTFTQMGVPPERYSEHYRGWIET